MADICPCPKKSTNIELTSVEGEEWWVCNHQGCEWRVSGAKHFWRPSEHAANQAAVKSKSKGSAKEEVDDDDDDDDDADE